MLHLRCFIISSILITGYASGLGRELAEQYLTKGYSLLLVDKQANPELQESLQAGASMQQKVHFLHVDITEPATLKQQLDYAVRKFGQIDICIHCAGILISKPFLHTSHDEFQTIMDINVIGTRNVVASVIPHLDNGAQLALVASMAGISGVYGYSSYGATKFAVVGMARALQLELAALGIDVSIICPPSIDTPMVQAESRSIHPATKAIKDMAGTLTVPEAAAYIIKGLLKRKPLIIPGKRAKSIYYAERFLPSLMLRKFTQWLISRHTHK
ncbi:SDR family NAD(P)-dependent oxidoreductase [Glaciecola siphonariae]|uniref:SDR family NAD(P)-dependent oxidoreductase n=1 Tax=Glaciecola siphonariae TaxID=521012 RepID=A0ABV9LY82_9ALTE